MTSQHTVWRRTAAVVVALLAVGVYLNALHNPYVYDDYRTILSNASLFDLRDWRALLYFDLPRPLTNISFAVDYAMWGGEPFGFHLTSVLLHAANAVLLFLLARAAVADSAVERLRGTSATTLAFVAASVFAVHPLMTEAVAYISSRSDVLATTFVLLAMLAARRWMQGGHWSWLPVTWGLWLGGIAAKETAALLPVALVLYDWLLPPTDERGRRQRLRLHLPLVIVALAGAAFRLWLYVVGEQGGVPRIAWLAVLTQLDVSWRYVALLLFPIVHDWPTGQSLFHDWPAGQSIFHDVPQATSVVSIVAIRGVALWLVLLALAWHLRRRAPLVTFGILWFATFLLPSASIGVLGTGDVMAEHRVYLASLGGFLVAGTCAVRVVALPVLTTRLRWLLAATFVVALLSLSGRTMLRNTMWSDATTLWSEAVERSPRAWIPRAALGESLQQSGRLADAAAVYREAIALAPDEERLYLQLATCLSQLQEFDAATETLLTLQRRAPDSSIAATGMGMVSLLSGRVDDARARFDGVLSSHPGNVLTMRWMAVLEEEHAANPAAAARWCREILKWQPLDPAAADCVTRNDAHAATTRPR